ncbi:DUF3306 domain-containing protein [Rhodoferax sp.]|uniref:DUF3306 domain-containing protein n=1 Tax=Rhodoferax sp. TaxID=50421 RepID=UPI00374D8910
MAEGFLARWSQRKQAQRAGKALDEALDEPATQPVPGVDAPDADPINQSGAAGPGAPASSPAIAPLSLDDVQRLTAESDFKPFVARGVAPEVRNAAMKKLFTDPHYNVMDRLDIYIDDYSQPDPLPQSMLRQMASAQFLNLFKEEKNHPAPPGDDADTGSADFVAQSAQPPDAGVENLIENPLQAPGPDHDHTDLRLQPNHAAGRPEPGRGAE